MTTPIPNASPRWKPLDERQRRVLGVLIEKSKTTPAGYPMSVNAITAGCNQAYCLATLALAKAGEEVMVPLPYYFNHQMWLDGLGVQAVHRHGPWTAGNLRG